MAIRVNIKAVRGRPVHTTAHASTTQFLPVKEALRMPVPLLSAALLPQLHECVVLEALDRRIRFATPQREGVVFPLLCRGALKGVAILGVQVAQEEEGV